MHASINNGPSGLRVDRPARKRGSGFRKHSRALRRTVPLLENLKQRLRHLEEETYVLYLAARHPKTPWYARAFIAVVVAYAFSPIDLIPDFVPVLGYLDDLILIPLGIVVARKMIPASVLAECRARAQASMADGKPTNRIAAALIIGIWLLLAALCTLWAFEAFAISDPTRPVLY